MKFTLRNFVFITIVTACTIQAQSGYSFNLFPDGLLFNPLQGNIKEPRFGLIYFPNNANLKIDIGYTSDLLEFVIDDRLTLRAGIDFFAYGLATSYEGNRLQIDMLDGFFGGNVSGKYLLKNSVLKSRLRIIHNSAHLVDGSFVLSQNKWKDDYKPIPYTRDFGELTVMHTSQMSLFRNSFYGSIAYTSLVRPSTIKKWTFNFGFESVIPKIVNDFYGRELALFLVYHNDLGGESAYTSSHTVKTGIKFGEWNKKGLLFYAFFYNGFNYFSEFYNQRIQKFGIGFNVDFSSAI